MLNQINPDIKKILKKSLEEEEISSKEALKLLKIHGKEFLALQNVANEICFKKKRRYCDFCY